MCHIKIDKKKRQQPGRIDFISKLMVFDRRNDVKFIQILQMKENRKINKTTIDNIYSHFVRYKSYTIIIITVLIVMVLLLMMN